MRAERAARHRRLQAAAGRAGGRAARPGEGRAGPAAGRPGLPGRGAGDGRAASGPHRPGHVRGRETAGGTGPLTGTSTRTAT